ncbi:hypothetical protein N7510_002448 [Penicillium lagena]|uniref:uncharacterized protein n=1 Tax=Penicillium lagena TaxID=94218 RepID=UPI00254123EF|nr:uncharacterized protein N7510_002448 [Penicillium lagena]KAJ5626139.1 hypothetical protein N7510_002448 [Penicillium lagena]
MREGLPYIPENLALHHQSILQTPSPAMMSEPDITTYPQAKYVCESLEQFDRSFNTIAASITCPLVQPTPIYQTPDNSSFLTRTEETPSLSSSLGFVDMPQDMPSIPNDAWFQPLADDDIQKNLGSTCSTVDSSSPGWLPLTMASSAEIWRSYSIPDSLAEDLGLAEARYCSTGWLAPNTSTTSEQLVASPVITHAHEMHALQQYPVPSPSPSSPTTSHNSCRSFVAPKPSSSHRWDLEPYNNHYDHPNTESILVDNSNTYTLDQKVQPRTQTPPPTENVYSSSSQPCRNASGITVGLHYTDSRNAFLIDWKRRGLSYKDIKRLGGFKEAESTLRGRFRTLTKAKEQRVRKPKWHKEDVELLIEAVNACFSELNGFSASRGPPRKNAEILPKVSWKKVAQHIWSHGGSYHFGNATCKKKWCEINKIQI